MFNDFYNGIKLPELDAGTYTVTAEAVNAEGVAEAYYANNKLSKQFTVTDLSDLSNVKFNAEYAPDFSSQSEELSAGKIKFSYEGLEALSDYIEGYTPLYQKWNEYTVWSGKKISDDLVVVPDYAPEYSVSPPAEINVTPMEKYKKVQFALGIKLKGESNPVFIYSDPVPLSIIELEDVYHGGILKVSEDGAQIEDEFIFELSNPTTAGSSDFTGTYQIALDTGYALSLYETYRVYKHFGEPKEFSIPAGESFSTTFDSFPEDLLSCGRAGSLHVLVQGYFDTGRNVINSIVVGNGLRDAKLVVIEERSLSGTVNVFSSIIGAAADDMFVTCRDSRSGVTKDEIYFCDGSGLILSENDIPKLRAEAIKGNLVTVSEGKLVYTSNGETVNTGVSAAFADSDYELDAVKHRMTGACGSIQPHTAGIYGDVNKDGKITVDDATMIQRASVEFIALTDEQRIAADVNADGRVTISDVTCVQKYLSEHTEGCGKTGQPIE